VGTTVRDAEVGVRLADGLAVREVAMLVVGLADVVVRESLAALGDVAIADGAVPVDVATSPPPPHAATATHARTALAASRADGASSALT
jgi:hypothetical protein